MDKKCGPELITYGILLAGLAYLAHRVAPSFARPALAAGLTGGALCILWGILALRGKCRKAYALLTLIPVSYVLLSQLVLTWGDRGAGESSTRLLTLLLVVMLGFSLGMLLKIAHAEAAPDGPASATSQAPPVPPQERPGPHAEATRPNTRGA